MSVAGATSDPLVTVTLVTGTGMCRREVAIDVVESAAKFASELLDVDRPSICPKCLYAFARGLCDPACEKALAVVLKISHPFWDACARMASYPGAFGDLAALRSVLDDNILECNTAFLHVHARGCLGDSASCLMDALCRCLSGALGGGSQRKQKNVFLCRRGAWPRDIESLMPFGIDAYARWVCMLPTRYPCALLSRLVVVARRDVMPGLLQSPTRHRVVATFVRTLHRWHVPASALAVVHHPDVIHDVPLGRPAVEEKSSIIGLVVHFISVFQSGPDRHIDDFAHFAAGFEEPLHDALIATLTVPGWSGNVQHDFLIRAASSLAAIGELPEHPIVRDFRSLPEVRRYFEDGLNVGDSIYVYFHQKLDSRLCSGPMCSNRAHETESGLHALSLCAKCKVMRYCGVECQVGDWYVGASGVPHKRTCSAVRKFTEAGLLGAQDRGMIAFSAAFFDTSFVTYKEFCALAELALLDDTLPRNVQVGALAQLVGIDVDDIEDDVDIPFKTLIRDSADRRYGRPCGNAD